MKRILLALTSLGLLLALFAILPQGVAFASGGPGHQSTRKVTTTLSAASTLCSVSPSEGNCTNQDPIAQGCNDAYTVAGGSASLIYAGTTYGFLELRYSYACQSNWARFTPTGYSSGAFGATFSVERPAQTVSGVSYSYQNIGYYELAPRIWTYMVYAPGTVIVKTCASVSVGSQDPSVCVGPI